MVLGKCPHMIARRPHYQRGCRVPESKHYHHNKHARAATITAISALKNFDVDRLHEEIREYMKEAQTFLGDTAFLNEQKKSINPPIIKR